ncbi:MAG: tetratricopeptide repeat protein [Thermodesulfovibrionales bacterium]
MNTFLGVSQATSVDSLFSSTANSLAQYDYLANTALAKGIDLYQAADYNGAYKEFRRVIGLSPFSDNAANAYTYMAMSQQKLGKTDEAVKTYKEAIRVYPTRDSFLLSLGDIYYKNGQLADAETQYKKAVQLDPHSVNNRYSLGQIYFTEGRLDEAQSQFTAVTKLAPASATGYFGLGQTFRKAGKYDDALTALEKATTLDKKFADAHLELGSTYADMQNFTDAKEQVDILTSLKSPLSSDLKNYISQVSNPKLSAVFSSTGFEIAGPGTLVSHLDLALSSVKSSKDFTVSFIFSKEMDKSSVQNIANWQIGRETGTSIADKYNFGMPIASTEVNVLSIPTRVVYDEDRQMATMTFRISQNASGNGTIDPSHIAFKFKGLDAYGKAMDPKADEYSGFSKIV